MKYYVGIHANGKRQIIEVEQDNEPNDDDMEDIYNSCIGNILDSGYWLLDDEEIAEAKSNGEV